jgi:hypothetical protein
MFDKIREFFIKRVIDDELYTSYGEMMSVIDHVNKGFVSEK